MKGRKMLRVLWVFLAFMLACTMLSRASSALTVAVVKTASPGKMVISHKVTATGKIEGNQELAISAESGQKISQILVREGELVNPGDVLLQMELGALKEQISSFGQELEKIELEKSALESSKRLQEQKRELAIQRAQEDYDRAMAKGDQAVFQAAGEWDQAVEELNAYYQNAEIQEEQESAYKEKIQAAQKAYEEAEASRDEALQTAVRALEDARVQEPPDNSVRIKEAEAKSIRRQMKKLQKFQEAGAKVTAPVKGSVTKIQATVGETTADAPLLFLADLSAGCRFTAQVEKEQEEYLGKGAPVTLSNEQKKKTVEDLQIDSVKVNPEDASLLDVCVYLPEDALEIGDSAKMTVEQKSGSYNTCIPIQALHAANGTYFVYVLQEEEAILGKQLTARTVNVTVQEQNETYAALDDGCLSGDQKVIQDASKTIDEGSPVRLDET